jgi:hypothetical protein
MSRTRQQGSNSIERIDTPSQAWYVVFMCRRHSGPDLKGGVQ